MTTAVVDEGGAISAALAPCADSLMASDTDEQSAIFLVVERHRIAFSAFEKYVDIIDQLNEDSEEWASGQLELSRLEDALTEAASSMTTVRLSSITEVVMLLSYVHDFSASRRGDTCSGLRPCRSVAERFRGALPCSEISGVSSLCSRPISMLQMRFVSHDDGRKMQLKRRAQHVRTEAELQISQTLPSGDPIQDRSIEQVGHGARRDFVADNRARFDQWSKALHDVFFMLWAVEVGN